MAPYLCLLHKEHAIVPVDSYWLLLRRPTLLLGFVVDEASLGLISLQVLWTLPVK